MFEKQFKKLNLEFTDQKSSQKRENGMKFNNKQKQLHFQQQ